MTAASFTSFLGRRRRLVLAGAAFLLAASAAVAATLPLHGDFASLLPSNTPSVRALRELERRVASFGTILVAVESDDPALRRRAAASVGARLARLDPALVATVTWDDREARDFAWRNRFLFAPIEDLRAVAEALGARIERAKLAENPLYVDLEDGAASGDGDQALRDRLERARAERDAAGGLVSKSGKMQLIVVRTTFDPSATDLAERLVAEVERSIAVTRAELGPAVLVGAQGDVYSALAEHDALLNGMLLATLFTVGLVAAGLALYFRTLRGLLALFFALAVGSAATFALTRLVIGSLNLTSWTSWPCRSRSALASITP